MYILESSKCKLDRLNGRWFDTELANAPITTLLTRYGEVYLYIRLPGTNNPVVKGLYLRKVQGWLFNVNPTTTVTQWLTSLGNTTLPFETDLLDPSARYVRYAQAWHSGYKVNPIGGSHDVVSSTNEGRKRDLILTHPDRDLSQFTEKALVTVNGFFHLCDRDDSGVRILEGNANIRRSKDNQVGIYSFETVGRIKCLPITTDCVSPLNGETPLYNGAYLKIPDSVDLENKTVLLVMGGYLNVLDDSYFRVADRSWRINFSKLLFLDRFYQSYKSLELHTLGLLKDPDNPTLLALSDLNNDDAMLKYLTMYNTFWVIVDTPTFFQEYRLIESLKLPGRSVDIANERLPLVGAYGRMMDYHVIKEPGQLTASPAYTQLQVYCASVNTRNHYDHNTRRWPNGKLVDAGRYPADRNSDELYTYRILGTEG